MPPLLLRAAFEPLSLPLPPFPDRRLAQPDLVSQLPPLRQCCHFINLTNGLEALPKLQQTGIQPSFVRIQSTLCEQGRLERLCNELDATLLLSLALGRCCLVYDFGSRNKKRGAPRALWYGLEFLRYVLDRFWLDLPGRAYLRGHDVRAEFDRHITGFGQSTRRRLMYYARYVDAEDFSPHGVRLFGVYKETTHDVDVDYYRRIARSNLRFRKVAPTATATDSGLFASPQDGEVKCILDTPESAQALLSTFGMHVFFGGLGHGELSRWKSAPAGGSADSMNVL